MKREEFIELLNDKGIKNTVDNGVLVVEGAYADLWSLKTMPDNVTFNNSGYVDLCQLKTLPDNVTFNNSGSVDLCSITTLPDNVTFNNSGSVDLGSLTTMPDNIKVVDGCGMKVLSKRKKGKYTIYNCEYLGIKKSSFVSEFEGFTAHGETVKESISDLEFKILQSTSNVNSIVSDIKRTDSITVNQFRLLTGACSQGCSNFIESNGIKKDVFTISEALVLIKGHYGSDRLNELLG